MSTLAENFLTQAEQDEVTAAVQEAELQTSGEIVPMIVSSSHDYPGASMTATFSLALPLALLSSGVIEKNLWLGTGNTWLFISLTAVLYILFYPVIKRTNFLRAIFLAANTIDMEVEKSALAAFYEEKLYKTKDKNGILIYISVLEKKVWVLADTSINAKIDQHEWDTIVSDLTQNIKAGNRAKAISRAVRETGQILQHHFPLKKNDQDELHNLIIK